MWLLVVKLVALSKSLPSFGHQVGFLPLLLLFFCFYIPIMIIFYSQHPLAN